MADRPPRPDVRYDYNCGKGHTEGWTSQWNTQKQQYQWKCIGCRKERLAEWKQSLRPAAIEHYGGRCACCSETWLDFLCIDHVDGGGAAHRKATKSNGGVYAWLKRNNYPEGYQVLCANCNMAKERGGCPPGHGVTR